MDPGTNKSLPEPGRRDNDFQSRLAMESAVRRTLFDLGALGLVLAGFRAAVGRRSVIAVAVVVRAA